MMHGVNWLLGAEVVVAVGLAAGPIARWTRNYVHKLAFPEGSVRTGAAEDLPLIAAEDAATSQAAQKDSGGSRSDDADAHAEPEWRPTLRRRWLLNPLPQGLLALTTCGGVAWWGGQTGSQVQSATALPVVALLGVAASADAVAHILPNRLLGSAALWLAGCGVIATAITPALAHDALRSVLCALAAGAISLLAALLRTGLGLGDVKLCAVIGLWLGWYGAMPPALALWSGVMLGGLMALAFLSLRRAGRKDPMAYGPYLIAGAFLVWPLAVP